LADLRFSTAQRKLQLGGDEQLEILQATIAAW
jgi:hypothetical protein